MDEVIDEDEQVLLRDNFKEICAVPDEVADDFLRAAGWNLESALQEFFHELGRSEEGIQNEANQQQERLRRRRPSLPGNASTLGNGVVSPTSTTRQVVASSWSQWAMEMVTLPLRLVWLSFYDLISLFLSLFRGGPLSVTDPRGDVRSFVADLDAQFGVTHPPFLLGSYNDALNDAKSSLRFLLVYLHSPSHQHSRTFVQSILCSQPFIDFVARHNLLLWACSVDKPEGYRASMALRENSYPFLALLCMRDHRMVMVLRLEGVYALDEMLSTLRVAIDENRPYLDAVDAERNERETTLRLRREQEADYQRALAADRARITERRRLESVKADEEKRLRDEAELVAARAKGDRQRAGFFQRLEMKKREIADGLPSEPHDGDVIRVSVKFPDGTRLERRFARDDSLEMLFNVTLVHEKCPGNFSLLSSYPRQQLVCAPDWYREFSTPDSGLDQQARIPTFRESGLDKAVMILVQDNDA